MKKVSARIHVILARFAPTALVIRRGPSKHVATMLWDRESDSFELGQWLKGRIYERRSDLSPDGKHFIYFAMNGKWNQQAQGAWTAVSRTPYLKAIALYPKGDCWHGGGLWTNNQQFWVNGGETLFETSEVKNHQYRPTGGFGAECLSVYYPRLIRDGWRLIDRRTKPEFVDAWEKPIGGTWILRKLAHAGTNSPEGKGCYWDEHELFNASNGIVVKKPDWEWADIDRDRLVWASNGCLFTGSLGKTDTGIETQLYDFNSMRFKPIEAPY